MDCPVCGHYNSYENSFCEECGADLYLDYDDDSSQNYNVQLRTCEYCGMMNPVDVQYCNYCQHDVWEKPPERNNNYNYTNTNNSQNVENKNNIDWDKTICYGCCFLIFILWFTGLFL